VIDALTGARPRSGRRARVLGALGLVALAALLAPRARLGAAQSCPPLPAGAGDIYVDAQVAPGGSGAESCPLRTVSAAIARTRSSDRHVTIHVARGRYDAALGEEFPIVVRGSVSIAGAGEDRTFIVGGGALSKHADDIEPIEYDEADNHQVTMLVGDDRATVELSGLAVTSGLISSSADMDGIYCDRGARSPFAQPAVPANTVLRHVTAGPGYASAVVAGGSIRPGRPSACNLSLSDSHLMASNMGLAMRGHWKEGTPSKAEVQHCVFSGLRSSGPTAGNGINVWAGDVRLLRVEDSEFRDSDIGVWVVHGLGNAPMAEVHIVGNEFVELSLIGVRLQAAAIVNELSDNDFHLIRSPAMNKGDRAVAVLVEPYSYPGLPPQIQRARGNRFIANDVAVELRGQSPGTVTPVIDFGSPGDPGRNVFHCNSTRSDVLVPGYDLLVSAPGSDGTGILFAGNVWDHAPPTVARGASAANGTDIVLTGSPGLNPDTSLATASEMACVDGVRGPP
jgi:hypothetical protein